MSIQPVKKKSISFDTLRLITCGSVDDGKSTLIGRMLFENKSIYEDQLEEIKNASYKNPRQKKNIDFSLLLDGLSSEREQKITIDVAYRYFSTKKRRFIIADTPGHEQYTRNMVTGATTANLAIILVNASKGILEQTIRHSFICDYLGIKNVILAINKMDKVKYSKKTFNSITKKYIKISDKFSFKNITCIPVAALYGYNIIKKSKKMDWYKGPSLLQILENTKIEEKKEIKETVFQIQLVQVGKNNKRFYLGKLKSGSLKEGENIKILPNNESNVIKKIHRFRKKKLYASEHENISIELKKT